MPPQAYALVTLFLACSVLAGVVAVRLVARRGGPRGRLAYVLPVLGGFGAFYLVGHRFGIVIGPEVGLFGFQVALLGDILIGFAAALARGRDPGAGAFARCPAGGHPARPEGRGPRPRSLALVPARFVAGRHRHSGPRPVAVGARVEDRVRQPGDPHRQRRVAGRHAGCRRTSRHPGPGRPSRVAQHVRGEEAPVRAEAVRASGGCGRPGCALARDRRARSHRGTARAPGRRRA